MNEQEFNELRRKALKRIEDVYEDTPIALELKDGTFTNIDCFGLFDEQESGDIYRLIVNATNVSAIAGDIRSYSPLVREVLDDQLVDMLQGLGEMQETILCKHCDAVLVNAYEPEPDEPIIPDDLEDLLYQ